MMVGGKGGGRKGRWEERAVGGKDSEREGGKKAGGERGLREGGRR